MGATYDAGMLIAGESGRRTSWLVHEQLLLAKVRVVVPVVVLSQVWRGGPQAGLSRMLRGCELQPVSVEDARAAGVACARAGTDDVVDALVVVGALRRGDVVYTSDPDDLVRLARALGRRLVVEHV